MIDELISNGNLTKCYHCHNDLKEKKDWKSEWNPGHHYKKITCDDCGHKVWVRVDFQGSGHDNWKPKEEPDFKNPLNSPRAD